MTFSAMPLMKLWSTPEPSRFARPYSRPGAARLEPRPVDVGAIDGNGIGCSDARYEVGIDTRAVEIRPPDARRTTVGADPVDLRAVDGDPRGVAQSGDEVPVNPRTVEVGTPDRGVRGIAVRRPVDVRMVNRNRERVEVAGAPLYPRVVDA